MKAIYPLGVILSLLVLAGCLPSAEPGVTPGAVETVPEQVSREPSTGTGVTPENEAEPTECSAWYSAESVQTDIEVSPDLTITLNRYAGLVPSPDYRVTIYGDGRVVYEGRSSVPTVGTVEKRIQDDQLRRIVTLFEEANFYGFFRCEHAMILMDSASLFISVEAGGELHELDDGGVCSYASMADGFCELGDKVDAILETPW